MGVGNGARGLGPAAGDGKSRAWLMLCACFGCGGDGAVPIEPIHDDGLIWTIMPCDLCNGSGTLRCAAVAD